MSRDSWLQVFAWLILACAPNDFFSDISIFPQKIYENIRSSRWTDGNAEAGGKICLWEFFKQIYMALIGYLWARKKIDQSIILSSVNKIWTNHLFELLFISDIDTSGAHWAHSIKFDKELNTFDKIWKGAEQDIQRTGGRWFI
jgi:hypothetical protein